MSAKKKKKGGGQKLNFVITTVTLSVIFIFVGYLIGQYAVKALQQQYHRSMQAAQEGSAQPVISSTNAAPPPAPAAPRETPATVAAEPREEAPSESAPNSALYRVQVGVFSERANAERMLNQLKEAGYEGIIISGPPHRVQTGAFSSQENAARLVNELQKKGFEAIIVR